jgi:hypothetical protein
MCANIFQGLIEQYPSAWWLEWSQAVSPVRSVVLLREWVAAEGIGGVCLGGCGCV